MLTFKLAFSLSPFTFIKRLFSFSLLSAIRMISSAYLRLLMFLLASLISACVSSSLAFHVMYSAKPATQEGLPWSLDCNPFHHPLITFPDYLFCLVFFFFPSKLSLSSGLLYNVLICLLFDFLQQNISSIMAEVFYLFIPTADSLEGCLVYIRQWLDICYNP